MSVEIRIGDCRELLRAMPDESVQCVVTSPPYWGLRDYGVVGQIGMEPTLKDHLDVMVDVFREVRRVLRKDGTCWVNYGDCYATSPNGRSAADTKAAGNDDRTFRDKPFTTIGNGLKPKDLCMIPNRLAIALQDDGWWVRSEIIWHKPNPMPESIKDRPGCSHEKMWLLSRSERYFYDHESVRQPGTQNAQDRADAAKSTGNPPRFGGNKGGGDQGSASRRMNGRAWEPALRSKDTDASAIPPNSRPHNLSSFEADNKREYVTANLRNVWTIPTASFSEAHFATFPPALVDPCIKAGCPEGGIVLDPFGGAGTVGLVADRLKRNSIMFELNPEYADIAERKLRKDGGMFMQVNVVRQTTPKPRCRKKPGDIK